MWPHAPRPTAHGTQHTAHSILYDTHHTPPTTHWLVCRGVCVCGVKVIIRAQKGGFSGAHPIPRPKLKPDSGPRKPHPAGQPGADFRSEIPALPLRLAKGQGRNPGPESVPSFAWVGGSQGPESACRFGRGLGLPGARSCAPESPAFWAPIFIWCVVCVVCVVSSDVWYKRVLRTFSRLPFFVGECSQLKS